MTITIMEPLGQSQVWRYLSGLSERHQIVLISYEKADNWADEEARERLKKVVRSKGVIWVPLRYHKKPSAIATAFDILLGILVGSYLTLKHRVKIVHARSYVPSVIALSLKKVFGLKFVFDMRGFCADGRVDDGIWPKGSRLYRVAKWFEQKFLLNADVVVSLTHTAVNDMQSFPYIRGVEQKFVVIPTCVNLQLFHPPLTTAERNRLPARQNHLLTDTLAVPHDCVALKAHAQDFSIDKAVGQHLGRLLSERDRPETVWLVQ